MLQVLGTVAEFERAGMLERQREGIEAMSCCPRHDIETYEVKVWAANQAGGGAVLRFALPLLRTPSSPLLETVPKQRNYAKTDILRRMGGSVCRPHQRLAGHVAQQRRPLLCGEVTSA
jgi:hypothetical protein